MRRKIEENYDSRIVPKMRKSGTFRTKFGARMGSISCDDDKNLIY